VFGGISQDSLGVIVAAGVCVVIRIYLCDVGVEGVIVERG
jgi:hypothetical protein